MLAAVLPRTASPVLSASFPVLFEAIPNIHPRNSLRAARSLWNNGDGQRTARWLFERSFTIRHSETANPPRGGDAKPWVLPRGASAPTRERSPGCRRCTRPQAELDGAGAATAARFLADQTPVRIGTNLPAGFLHFSACHSRHAASSRRVGQMKRESFSVATRPFAAWPSTSRSAVLGPRRPTRGFTSIECLIATVILGIGVIAVAGMLACDSLSERSAANLAQARHIAEGTQEAGRSGGYDLSSQTSGSRSVPTAGVPRSRAMLASQSYASGSEGKITRVALDLTWSWPRSSGSPPHQVAGQGKSHPA